MPQNIMDRLASGLFGGLLGPDSDALSPEAQQAANSQGLLSMAGGMLTASQDPFATFGGSVGQGLLAGQKGFRDALDAATAAKLRGAQGKYYDAQGTSLLRKTQAELERERRWQEFLNPSVQTFGAQRPPTPQGVPIDSDQQPPMTQGLAPQNAAAPAQARFNDPLWLVSTGQRAMANGFIDRGKKMVEAGVKLRPEMTTLMRNAEAAGFKPGTPEYQEFIRAQLAKSGQTINVNTGDLSTAEKKATEKFGGGIGDRANARINEGLEASNQNAKLDRIKLAIAKGAETGFGQETLLNLKSTAQSLFGLELGPEVGQQEAIRQISNEMALRLRNPESGLGLTGNTSNKDLAFLKNSVPGLQRTPQGNEQIIDFMQRLNKMKQDVARYQQGLINQNNGVVPADLDSQVLDYVNDYQLFTQGERQQIEQLKDRSQQSPSLIGGNRFSQMSIDELRQVAQGDLSALSAEEFDALEQELEERGL